MQQLLNQGIFPSNLSCVFIQRSWTILKTCDLEINLQGEIGLQTWKIFVLNFYIDPFGIFAFTLKLSIDHLNISQMILKTGDLDLDLQGQIGLEI